MFSDKMIVVTGPTATGKTSFAAHLAYRLNGEIISADSRQVYTGMDLGTGKDYEDYVVKNLKIPYHLVDIREPGYEYNVYEFQSDFLNVYKQIIERNRVPVLCGGTGLYIESVLKAYKLIKVPENKELREQMENMSDEELTTLLRSYKVPHNTTDTKTRNRLVKAIEIQQFYNDHPETDIRFPEIDHIILGIHFSRSEIRERITKRLTTRIHQGMVDEVKNLLESGLKPSQLKFYGLEYKFLTQYIVGEITFEELFNRLNTAIHQFAKRQMTWFRRMEKQGHKIHWIDGNLELDDKVETSLKILDKFN